jgi:glycosyltransferase involved in cell wall biosynthesis
MLVSVVIPTYNGADHLGDAIRSVLGQTYEQFELIVVNDASPDDTDEVLRQFDDPRLHYIKLPKNGGAVASRNTAVLAARGELIAFLDQDDYYTPDKLAAHVAFMQAFPTYGASYNARFELNHAPPDEKNLTIRDIWRTPHEVTLRDLVMGFPISPSDLVLRREWAVRSDLWDTHALFHGGEIVSNGRLFLAGCRFGGIDRALNYRRNHAGRRIRNLARCCESYLLAQDTIFGDPSCPPEVQALATRAHADSYLVWASYAVDQDETALAQEYIRKVAELAPDYVTGEPCHLVKFLMIHSIWDDTRNHASVLRRLLDQLPPEFAGLHAQYPWAVGRGYLLRAVLALTWGRDEAGAAYFAQALAANARLDTELVEKLAYQMVSYELQFGVEAANALLRKLTPYLEQAGPKALVRSLHGSYAAQRAFRHYAAGRYELVRRDVLQSFVSEPKYLTNRGMMAILWRSVRSGRPPGELQDAAVKLKN